MNLREAHDIGEALQLRLETVEGVERAFVHLDYETEHHPSSEHPALRADAPASTSADAEVGEMTPVDPAVGGSPPAPKAQPAQTESKLVQIN